MVGPRLRHSGIHRIIGEGMRAVTVFVREVWCAQLRDSAIGLELPSREIYLKNGTTKMIMRDKEPQPDSGTRTAQRISERNLTVLQYVGVHRKVTNG